MPAPRSTAFGFSYLSAVVNGAPYIHRNRFSRGRLSALLVGRYRRRASGSRGNRGECFRSSQRPAGLGAGLRPRPRACLPFGSTTLADGKRKTGFPRDLSPQRPGSHTVACGHWTSEGPQPSLTSGPTSPAWTTVCGPLPAFSQEEEEAVFSAGAPPSSSFPSGWLSPCASQAVRIKVHLGTCHPRDMAFMGPSGVTPHVSPRMSCSVTPASEPLHPLFPLPVVLLHLGWLGPSRPYSSAPPPWGPPRPLLSGPAAPQLWPCVCLLCRHSSAHGRCSINVC